MAKKAPPRRTVTIKNDKSKDKLTMAQNEPTKMIVDDQARKRNSLAAAAVTRTGASVASLRSTDAPRRFVSASVGWSKTLRSAIE